METENLSARAYVRVLKIARTIADWSAVTLNGVEGAKSADIKTEHIAGLSDEALAKSEAIQYRTLARDFWA